MRILLKTIAVLFIFSFLFTLSGCHDHYYDDGYYYEDTVIIVDAVSCPSVYDDITWDSYGEYDLYFAGDESTGWELVDECGWNIYEGHDGYGSDTLQVASPNEEVVFVWSFAEYFHGEFTGFDVVDGWRGETLHGAYIDMYTSTFHRLHPEFYRIDRYHSEYFDGYYHVTAYFDTTGHLERIYVGYNFRY